MSPRTAAIVLWCGLALVLPLPIPTEMFLGWWPLLKWSSWAWQADSLITGLGALDWALALVLIAAIYARWARRLPPKWPGALVGLTIWALLIATATLPLYRDPVDGTRTTFMRLYDTAPH